MAKKPTDTAKKKSATKTDSTAAESTIPETDGVNIAMSDTRMPVDDNGSKWMEEIEDWFGESVFDIGDNPDLARGEGDKGKGGKDDQFPTAPTYFDPRFIPYNYPDHSTDCEGLSLTLPAAVSAGANLGDVSGLDEAESLVDAIFGKVKATVPYVRYWLDRLPGTDDERRQLEGYLDQHFPGEFDGPPPPQAPSRGDVERSLGEALDKTRELESRLYRTENVTRIRRIMGLANPQAATITAPPGQKIAIHIFSQMLSTYSDSGRGTSHSDPNAGVPRIDQSEDLPWFAKVKIPQAVLIQYLLSRPKPPGRGNILQLGIAGQHTAIHAAELQVPQNGQIRLPMTLADNYGKALVIVTHEGQKKCLAHALFKSQGPYEDHIAAAERARFARIEARRDAILNRLSLIADLLVLLGIAITIIPVPIWASLGNFVVRVLERGIQAAKRATKSKIDAANKRQRRMNLTMAEAFPELGPVGGPEDNPLP